MFNDFDEHWKFWDAGDFGTPNIIYVHPCKQFDVTEIYKSLLAQPNISLFVVFGSAVTIGCHWHSDVDIYIETFDGKIDYDLPYMDLRSDVDVICNIHDWSFGVAKEIAKKGIVIFDRRTNV